MYMSQPLINDSHGKIVLFPILPSVINTDVWGLKASVFSQNMIFTDIYHKFIAVI